MKGTIIAIILGILIIAWVFYVMYVEIEGVSDEQVEQLKNNAFFRYSTHPFLIPLYAILFVFTYFKIDSFLKHTQ